MQNIVWFWCGNSVVNRKVKTIMGYVQLLLYLFIIGTANAAASECMKSAKVETYIETAQALMDKIWENLPAGEPNCDCPRKPMDCSEILTCGHNRSGIYKIWPRNRIVFGSIDVFCDMVTEGGGWTVLQKRGDYKRPTDFFNQNWHKYKTGFGDLRKDFWLGNENIYALTNQDRYYLLLELTDYENRTRSAFYDQFWIDNEEQNYKLHVHDFSGDAGNELSKDNGYMFSTHDKNNTKNAENCVHPIRNGWWFSNCQQSNPNGPYSKNSALYDNFAWGSTPLKKAEIKIRPAEFRDSLDMDIDAV